MQTSKPRLHEFVIGSLFVAVAIFLHIKFMGTGVIGLNIGLVVSFVVWLFLSTKENTVTNKTFVVYLAGVLWQCLHFGEEYLTGFQTKFPLAMFGYVWSDRLFVAFNLIWLCVFILAAIGLLYKVRLALLVVLFFALIGGIGNGIFHPFLSLNQGGYFPGLITSFGNLLFGVLIIKHLFSVKVVN